MQKYTLGVMVTAIMFAACSKSSKQQAITTPWGETLEAHNDNPADVPSYSDIISNGEMIMLTISGPDTYYDYKDEKMGIQYKMCQMIAQKIGVALRVEVCKSEIEMLRKLNDGEGDIIVYQIKKNQKGTIPCGYRNDSSQTAWAVEKNNQTLAEAINEQYSPTLLSEAKKLELIAHSSRGIKRHVYAPMLNPGKGIISKYDHLFMRYAPIARWDWRLLAAQCYQESGFDPMARSWAGARGLMQIMPATAAHLNLSQQDIYEPEPNIYAAVRYINELNSYFKDVRNPYERQFFVMASYNGGHFHIRDAMNLAAKNGKNKYNWDDVEKYVLALQSPEYYTDEVVKYGYMRGSETVEYVERIRNRWKQYTGKAGATNDFPSFGTAPVDQPHRASKRHRFKI